MVVVEWHIMTGASIISTMRTQPDAVVMRLVELQGARSDQAMADLLGMSRPHWWRVKAGDRSLSRPALLKAVRAFPEIKAEAIAEIDNAAGAQAASAQDVTRAPSLRPLGAL
jgi:hypothetical protein